MENKREKTLFGFTRQEFREATKEFEKLDLDEIKQLFKTNPLAKMLMEDFLNEYNFKEDD